MAFADIWERVNMTSADSCWPYLGPRGRDGYGQVFVAGRQRKAHRLAYESAVGPIPDGLVVMHRCDNPPCCNPAHLTVGTRADNNLDRVAKGRSASGERHGSRTHPGTSRGERNAHVRLSEADVRAIRERYGSGETQVALAASFGVARRSIRSVLDRRNWGWLP